MSQIVANKRGVIDGEELSQLLEVYLWNTASDRLGAFSDESGAGLLLAELFGSELKEIAALTPESVPSAAMWMNDCVIACSAATLTEAPPKAINLVAEEVSKLRERLQEMVKDARPGAA